MATVATPRTLHLGPEHNGVRLTPRQFDAADFDWEARYELIDGILIVSPSPLEEERDPNEELGRWLRNYQSDHPNGSALNRTLPEHMVRTGRNRRRADRVIWAGLGRRPKRGERPTIVVEFVSAGRRNFERDYEEKRDEYLGVGVKEYWIIDRFARTMIVYAAKKGRGAKRSLKERDTYTTPLLPGFELPLAPLLAMADDWRDEGDAE